MLFVVKTIGICMRLTEQPGRKEPCYPAQAAATQCLWKVHVMQCTPPEQTLEEPLNNYCYQSSSLHSRLFDLAGK